MIIICS